MADMDATKSIEIDGYTSERLDEIRASVAELEQLTGFQVEGFPGFDLKNDEHLIHSLIGTTARTLRLMVEEARRG